MVSILWLRQDLRVHDQPALAAAAAEGPVVPVYVLDDVTPGRWAIGAAQRWWLHHSLERLGETLAALGSRLVLRRGESGEALARIAAATGATRIHAIRHYEPWWVEAEARVAERLDLVLHDGNQLAPPATVRTGAGRPFRIYTPFWRALQRQLPPPEPLPAPDTISAPDAWPESDSLADWALLPTRPDWAAGFGEAWQPGEAGAQQAIDRFAPEVGSYLERRNLPGEEGTSRLSPHLHFGEISPAGVYRSATQAGADGEKFVKELAWRDFAQGMMASEPGIGERHARPGFDRLAWRSLDDPQARANFEAWTRGRTGYPIVDAGMRQLWRIGWIHNRVRMVAASFLVKHLLIDWREGARWFWDTLVDADYGNNGVNWQWIAGTGFDANHFARIMAPLTQSARFDAAGYIRRWVPELAHLPAPAIHDPEAFDALPRGYPPKLIGHREARSRALAALAAMD